MPDDTPLSDAERAALEATIQAAARDILAGFDRERVSPGVAIAICTFALDTLLQQAPQHRNEVLAALVPADDADA